MESDPHRAGKSFTAEACAVGKPNGIHRLTRHVRSGHRVMGKCVATERPWGRRGRAQRWPGQAPDEEFGRRQPNSHTGAAMLDLGTAPSAEREGIGCLRTNVRVYLNKCGSEVALVALP